MTILTLYKFLCTLIVILLILSIIVVVLMAIISALKSKDNVDQYIKSKRQEDLIDRFYENLNIVSSQTTQEILECLIEMENLDQLYTQIVKIDKNFMNDISYLKLKEKTLSNIIDEKIINIKSGTKVKENLKGLLDEIDVCRKRYPQYNEVYVEKTNAIKEKMETKKGIKPKIKE